MFERPGCWQRNKLIDASASLRNLQWSPLVSDGLLEGLDVLLLVIDLLHGFAEVGLQLVVSVVRLCDSLLERHVRVVPVAPHLVRTLGDDNCYCLQYFIVICFMTEIRIST